MTANATQRVDVERQVFAGIPLHEAISLARRYAGSENKLRPRLSQTLESLADALPALLQQLAERDAEIARLNRLADAISRDCNDCANQRNEAMAKAVAAERAREEVERDALLMARWISNLRLEPWQEVDQACEQCRPGGEIVKTGFICGRHTAAAFLAANAPTNSAGGE